MHKTAGIAIIGEEILSGKVEDENARFLIRELRDLGVSLRHIAMIPDEVEQIARTVADLAASCDYVFTSGGVGPTHDDVTIAGVARAFDTDVVAHPELLAVLEQHYGRPPTAEQARLAEVPRGAELTFGDRPTWPVVRLANVYILPGVPSLFRKKFLSVRERFREAPFSGGRIYCQCEETDLAEKLSAAVAAHPTLAFGSYPRFEETEYRVLVTIDGKDTDSVRTACRTLAASLGEVVVRIEEPE